MPDRALFASGLSRDDAETIFNRHVASSLPAMVAFWRRDLSCAFANGAYREWFGRSPEQMFGCHLRDLLGDALFERNRPYIDGALAGREQRFERTLVKADGTVGHTLASYIPRLDENGAVLGFVAQVVDVSPLENTRRSLALSALVIDCMVEGVVVADLEGRIVSVNPAFTRITGFERHEVLGLTTHLLGLDRDSDAFRALIVRAIAETGFWRGDIRSLRKDGVSFIAEQTTTIAHGPGGEPLHYVSLFHDVTDARASLAQLAEQASRDMLTGLCNRATLIERLHAMTNGSRADADPFVLLFIDLDDFKSVNDRHGHAAGDQFLRAAANRLSKIVREGDVVARFAGDEFVVVLTSAGTAAGLAESLTRIERELCEPIALGDRIVPIGASIGIASYPGDGHTPDALLAHADAAMYAAKRRALGQRG